MRKKTFILLCVLVLAILLFVLWLLFRSPESTPVPTEITDVPCLVFQSSDPSQPCFVAESPSVTTGAVTLPIPPCLEGSVFEKNDCISKIAEERKDESLCSDIQGSVARTACLMGVRDLDPSPVPAAPKSTFEVFLRASVSQPSLNATSSQKNVETLRNIGAAVLSSEDTAKMTPEGFYTRFANEAGMFAYNVSPYQSRPGDTVKIQGSGFALDATNVVHIGGVDVPGIASTDGVTISVTIPSSASLGTSEVWVTNSRGTTRVSERPIYAVISQSPVAPPEITGFSPENPTYTDVITLSGKNMNGIQAISTTLGIVQGNSASFRVSDLEYAHLVLDQASSKGSTFPLSVYVQAEGGLSEQPFIIEVQF